MYKKVSTDLNFVDREKEIAKYWADNDIFKKSMENRKEGETYTFYDGPPTANGKPHIGHVLTRVIKDMIPRYQTMKGKYVPRKAGWDTHGLPVELEVEKLLGLDGKEQIEEYGLEPFINKCRESVWKYKGMWEDFSGTVGFWADMDNPYVTYEDDYIESEWWALKKIWDKKLLYKGFKIVPYCPRCGTPLSSHEVAQGYKDVKEKSAVVRFKVKGEDAYFLAWTTTPWTLPSNVALCVNPDEKYIKVSAADGKTYYLAQALADSVLGSLSENEDEKAYTVLETYVGKDLEKREYEPLFDFANEIIAKQNKKAFYITCDDYVTMGDGSGIVHIAPAFGEDDANVGRKYDLPFVQLVNEKGEMTQETSYAGLFCKKADKHILKDLDAAGLLFDAPAFEHSYPHCWRCDTPLIYYARESWFIKMTEVKDNLVRNNKTVNWIPESIGSGRFGDWLENIQDWGISRNRYWGTPLNVWTCDCGHMECIGSRQELFEKSKDEAAKSVELHRPFIDKIELDCPECGGKMHRVSEVIDCWFDSGAMPFAQHHYPFENQDVFEKQFPAAFISEAVDQTRGWFYSLMAESTLLFDKAPYENVIVLGHVQDENGQKMSKSKGNAVDPFDALANYGADAIRWYFYINSAPWLPNRFHGKAVLEGQRKFLSTLWNTYAFYVLYANIDEFEAADHKLDMATLNIMDKWLLSKLNTLIITVDEALSSYKIPEAARALDSFVEQMSNWYVRRSRERFWAKGMEQDKINAYMTLYTAIVTVCKCAAPMVPFMTEEIYQNLVAGHLEGVAQSIHLCDYPTADKSMIDTKLEEDMQEVLSIVSLSRAARNAANIKNRQPIGKLYIKAQSKLSDYYIDTIKDELNVKEASFKDDVSEYTDYTFKPQLRTVGPKYGKFLKQIQKALSEIDGSKAMKTLAQEGSLKFPQIDPSIELLEEDLLITISHKEGYMAQENGDITVVIETTLSEELIEEGFVREIISKVQTMRKEADFDVMDRIKISSTGNDKIADIFDRNADLISKETLADEIVKGEILANSKEWNINGEKVTLSVERKGN